MSDWARVLVCCAFGGSAICLTISVISDILLKQRNRRVIRRRLRVLADPEPRCVVRNEREPV